MNGMGNLPGGFVLDKDHKPSLLTPEEEKRFEGLGGIRAYLEHTPGLQESIYDIPPHPNYKEYRSLFLKSRGIRQNLRGLIKEEQDIYDTLRMKLSPRDPIAMTPAERAIYPLLRAIVMHS